MEIKENTNNLINEAKSKGIITEDDLILLRRFMRGESI